MTRGTATTPGPAIPPAAATDVAVLTQSLGKTYPDGTVAVADLNLALRRGEVLGLLGPNGAGKSSIAGMLTTTVRPTSGRAWSLASMPLRRQAGSPAHWRGPAATLSTDA